MINDVKLGIKIMRYGHGITLNIIIGVLLLVTGLANVFLVMKTGAYNNMGFALFMMCVCMLPAQIIFSLNVTGMVLASPVRKKMQTTIPSVINCGCMLTMYVITDILLLIMACINPDRFPIACRIIAMQSVFAVIIMIYMPLAYKYMVLSMFIFIIGYALGYAYAVNSSWFTPAPGFSGFFDKGASSFAFVSVLGLPIIVLGGFLSYLMSLLVYKAPVTKYSQNVYLRKEL